MEYYEITLNGIYHLLKRMNEKKYADIISDCITKWKKQKDVTCFAQAFLPNGSFVDFQFSKDTFTSEEQRYWVQELMGALTAMAAQLAVFTAQNRKIDIEFIRKNFGRLTEVINGTACTSCSTKGVTLLDIDKYISGKVIAKKIVDGLAIGKMNNKIDEIITLSAPEIRYSRNEARERIANSKIPVSDSYEPTEKCPFCGSSDITQCRFLKSLKQNIFIPLGK